jgi:cobalt-zinc-cadmium efflux system protein
VSHHDHAGDRGGDPGPGRLGLAAALNGGFGIAQIVGGLALGSVAVLADAVHQGADSVGLLVAVAAALLARRAPSARRTFGWGRMDAVGAQISGVVLLGGIGWLAWESIERLRDPVEVGALGVSVFGALGIAVNAGSLVLLRRGHAHVGHGHGSLAVRAARLHLLTDLGGSAAVLVAGVGVASTGWERLDPAASLLIAAAASVAAIDLVRRASDVLLDRSPSHLDPGAVADVLSSHPGVVGVHHVHLWSIGAHDVALSAHVQMAGELVLHDVQEHTRELEALVSTRFGIGHTTLQVECHDCEQPAHG